MKPSNQIHSRTARTESQAGFTLIELIIAIALLMIVMLMVMQMFLSAQALYRIASERAEVFSQGRAALDVIEADLQRTTRDNFADFLALSSAPVYGSTNPAASDPLDPQHYHALYQDTKGGESAADYRPDNQTSERILPFLTFNVSSESWYDAQGRIQSGPAQVSYYLKRKPDMPTQDGPMRTPQTAYLMKYVIPIRNVLPGAARQGQQQQDYGGSHIEVASSVRAVRVWAYNNAVPAYMSQRLQVYELFPRVDNAPTPSAAMMRTAERRPDPNATPDPVKLQHQQNQVLTPIGERAGQTYSWGNTPGSHTENIRSRANFPLAIGIEITFANDGLDVVQGEYYGTFRTMRRVITIPNTEAAGALEEKEIQDHFRAR